MRVAPDILRSDLGDTFLPWQRRNTDVALYAAHFVFSVVTRIGWLFLVVYKICIDSAQVLLDCFLVHQWPVVLSAWFTVQPSFLPCNFFFLFNLFCPWKLNFQRRSHWHHDQGSKFEWCGSWHTNVQLTKHIWYMWNTRLSWNPKWQWTFCLFFAKSDKSGMETFNRPARVKVFEMLSQRTCSLLCTNSLILTVITMCITY